MSQVHHSDVIGSLLRPKYLTRARDIYAAGQLTTAEFKRIEDRAVDQAIAMQEGVGPGRSSHSRRRQRTSRSSSASCRARPRPWSR